MVDWINIRDIKIEFKENREAIDKYVDISKLYTCNVSNVDQKNMKTEKHTTTHEEAFEYCPCKQCNKILSSKYVVGTHRNTEQGKIDCDKPTFKFDKAQNLYTCNTCFAEYQNQAEVEKHLESHEKNFKCSFCDEKFQSAYDLGAHSVIHYDDNMFRCPLCAYKTLIRRYLLLHVNHTHLKKVPYTCKECGKGFTDPVYYKEHNNEHLGVKPFTCIVCTKAFTFSRYLFNHQMRMHRVDIDGQVLTNHCTICKEVFAKPTSLEKHFRKRHVNKPSEKKYLCDTCGKGFIHQHELNIHYRMHTGVKPFTCTVCSKTFARRDYLVTHKRVHSGEKPHACEYCGKSFSQRGPFKIHQRSHTGEKPYVCQCCSKGFTSKRAMDIHCKSCTGEI